MLCHSPDLYKIFPIYTVKKGVKGTDIIHWVEVANLGTCSPEGATMSHIFHHVYMLLFKKMQVGGENIFQNLYSEYALLSTTYILLNRIINSVWFRCLLYIRDSLLFQWIIASLFCIRNFIPLLFVVLTHWHLCNLGDYTIFNCLLPSCGRILLLLLSFFASCSILPINYYFFKFISWLNKFFETMFVNLYVPLLFFKQRREKCTLWNNLRVLRDVYRITS